MKLFKLLLIAALFSIVFFSACSEDEEKYEPRLEKVGNWNIVFLKGTPYEMGRQQSEVFEEGLMAAYNFFFGSNKDFNYVMPEDNIFGKPGGGVYPDGIRLQFVEGFNEARYSLFDSKGVIIGNYDEAREKVYDKKGNEIENPQGTNVYDIIMETVHEDVLEECEGIVDGNKSKGLDGLGVEDCVAMNSVMYLLEVNQRVGGVMDFGCHGFVANSKATKSGEVIHGRSLDWPGLTFTLQYPTLFVRQPKGKIPYVGIGFPSQVTFLTGLNSKGISVGVDEVQSNLDEDFPQKGGDDMLQVMKRILEEASSLAEANAIMKESSIPSSELLHIASASDDAGQVYEVAGPVFKIKPMNDAGTVYVTNNYTGEDILAVDGLGYTHPSDAQLLGSKHPVTGSYSSEHRYMRLHQFFGDPDHADYMVGEFDIEKGISVLRDRKFAVVPYSLDGTTDVNEVYEHGYLFRNGHILGTNSVFQSIIMEPGTGNFWVAGGIPNDFSLAEMSLLSPNPIGTHNYYHGFNLNDLLDGVIDSGLTTYDNIPASLYADEASEY